MSGRDWRTIGVDAPPGRAPLPPWIGWAIPPLLAPLAAMAWVAIRWDRIPLRYATNFGPGGHANGWQTRTPLHVCGPLIFAEGLAVWMLTLALIAWYGMRRSGGRSTMETIFLAVMYVLSLIFTVVAVTPVVRIPAWPVAMLVPVAAISLLIYVARKAMDDPDPEPGHRAGDTPKECWSLGGIYNNPKDPALFVPKPDGLGYTLNMANRLSYAFLAGLLAGIAALSGFLLWSQR